MASSTRDWTTDDLTPSMSFCTDAYLSLTSALSLLISPRDARTSCVAFVLYRSAGVGFVYEGHPRGRRC